MAALPKKKISKVRGKTRRAGSLRLTPLALAKCPKCGSLRLPHAVCESCGYYGDLKVITTLSEKKVAEFLRRQKREEAKKAKKQMAGDRKGIAKKTTPAKSAQAEAKEKPPAAQAPKPDKKEAKPTPEKKTVLEKALVEKQKSPKRGFWGLFRRRKDEQ